MFNTRYHLPRECTCGGWGIPDERNGLIFILFLLYPPGDAHGKRENVSTGSESKER